MAQRVGGGYDQASKRPSNQTLEGFQQEGQAVGADFVGVEEPGVQAEDGQHGRRAFRGRQQRWVVVQPEALPEPDDRDGGGAGGGRGHGQASSATARGGRGGRPRGWEHPQGGGGRSGGGGAGQGGLRAGERGWGPAAGSAASVASAPPRLLRLLRRLRRL